MPDNVAPMLDDVPEPDDDDYSDREADLSERDPGAHEEHLEAEAELRDPPDANPPDAEPPEETDS